MFLNLWSKPRSEQTMAEALHVRPNSPLHTPTRHTTPLLNKMKRKRDDGGLLSPQREAPSSKKKMETMSHVQVPAYDVQRVPLSSHANQAEWRAPVAPANIDFPANASQQTDLAPRLDKEASNLPVQRPVQAMGIVKKLEGHRSNGTLSLKSSLASVRETIESQFSLEILLKHRELRLIDQELAKCQIAFEQLRRCHAVPYPASSSGLVDMESVTNGSGAVYNNTAPQAPPWGVTNGPYTQHYARWLLQDPSFDDTIPAIPTSAHTGQNTSDRLTRGSKSERNTAASKSRSSRVPNHTRLSALPDGYPVPKEEKGPCIVVRSSDAKKVKLICRDCWRSDFSSAQGFINHCRIQHHKTFKSHDAAINECGEAIDGDADESNVDVGAVHQGAASAGLVHPLVRSAFSHSASMLPKPVPTSLRKRKASSAFADSAVSSANASMSSTDRLNHFSTPQRAPGGNLNGHSGSQQPLIPSPQTPHLSALLARLGTGGDLAEMVTEAKRKPEIDLDQLNDSEDEEDVEEEDPQPQSMIKSHSTRGVIRQGPPARVNTSPARRQSLGTDGANESPKSADAHQNHHHHRAYPSLFSVRPDDVSSQTDTSMLDVNTPLNLSPNTTDPHPAPSLVSDDGDYENMHSDSESPSDVGDEREPHHEPEVIDHDDMDMGEGSGLNLGHAKHHHPHHPHHHHHGPPTEMVAVGRRSRPTSTTTNAFEHGPDRVDEQRHVSFANPPKGSRRGSKAKDAQ